MIVKFLLMNVMTIVSSQLIHKLVAPEEMQKTFATKRSNPNSMSNFEIVAVDVLEVPSNFDYNIYSYNYGNNNNNLNNKNNYNGNGLFISLKPFGEHIKMWLNPVDGILAGEDLPIYTFSADPNNRGKVRSKKHIGLMKYSLPKLYENTLHATTLAINNHRDGKKSMTGFIGNFYIRPVPSQMINQVKRYRRSLNDTDHLDNKIYHIIQNIPESEMKKELPLTVKPRSKRSYPTVLYPEVLVIVDYSLNSKFRGNMKEILIYLLSYWNGVDMRFRGIENPKIRLNIAGLLFAQDPWVLSYIKNYIEGNRVNDYISKIESKGRWLYRMNSVIPINSYDVAVTMMTHKMCDYQGCAILGVSPVGSACHVDHAHQTMYKVLIVRDTGAYEGISSTVHELGHAFGMNHDGQINRRCPSQSGYIMAPSDVHTSRQFDWSLCSLLDLQNFIKMNPKCMFNKPNQGKELQRFLPGKLMDANKQCQMLNAIRAYVINDSICLRLQCLFGGNALLSDYVVPAAAEGTTCSVGKICLHGKCVYESQITY